MQNKTIEKHDIWTDLFVRRTVSSFNHFQWIINYFTERKKRKKKKVKVELSKILPPIIVCILAQPFKATAFPWASSTSIMKYTGIYPITSKWTSHYVVHSLKCLASIVLRSGLRNVTSIVQGSRKHLCMWWSACRALIPLQSVCYVHVTEE